MRALPLVLLAACASTRPPAQAATPARPDAVFRLYKFLQPIGTERSTFAPDAVRTTFTFNDRTTDVTLASQLSLEGGRPVRLDGWGRNARGNPWEVHAQGKAPLVSGYAPVIAQEFLVREWLRQGRPARLPVVPEGEVRVTSRGKDALELNGERLSLEHLAIEGLVWGREDVWIEDDGALVGLVTRDAEFDHFEALRTDATPLAEALVARAGADAIAWLGQGAAPVATGPIAFVNARLIDGTGTEPVEGATVVVDGDRIVAAGRGVEVPAGARRIDVKGASILPGLWDMHAHVEQVEQAAAYLAAGVTTVRDLGNILPFITAVRDAIEGGKGLGPRVLVDPLMDSDGRFALGILRVNSPADVGPVLDTAQRAGAREIKIYSGMKPALVPGLVAEAHRRGLRVTGHVPSGMDINEALEAGFDGINHVNFALELGLPETAAERAKLSFPERRRRAATLDLSAPRVQRMFELFKARGAIYDPTLALMELFEAAADALPAREPGLAKLPPQLRGIYQGASKADASMQDEIFRKQLEVVRELHRRGVPIVAGTDIGVPGHSLHRELELYVQAGFTPLEALQSATLVPARVMGLDRELGTIAAGKRADLVIVEGNPAQDISAIRRVKLVVTRGRAFEPAPLWTLAGFVP